MERLAVITPRSLDYFSESELTQRLGYQRGQWHHVAIKELIDNSLDACEAGNIEHIKIEVIIEDDGYSVKDNGSGLPLSVLQSSCDYEVRVSSNAAYISPTRGQLGNALKCIWAIPFVEDGKKGCCKVSTKSGQYLITTEVDEIRQMPQISLQPISEDSIVKTGTKIKVFSSKLGKSFNQEIYTQLLRYSLVNPHVSFALNGENLFPRLQNNLLKMNPSHSCPVNWFNYEKFKTLLLAYIIKGRESDKVWSIREFIGIFAKLSSTQKIKAISDALNVKKGETLESFIKDEKPDNNRIKKLFEECKSYEVKILSKKLGCSGIKAYNCYLKVDGKYKKIIGDIDGVPFVVEVGFWYDKQFLSSHQKREDIFAINYSLILKNPYDWHDFNSYILKESYLDPEDPVILYIHLIYPLVAFTESGKGSLKLPSVIRDSLNRCVKSVTKDWAKAKKSQKREEKASLKTYKDIERAQIKKKISLKEACNRHMETAYMKASGGNKLPANARQIMYAIRPLVLQECDHFFKHSSTFTQTILNEFIRDNPQLTATWDVVFDARGNLVEPHTRKQIRLGTLEVRNYIQNFTNGEINTKLDGVKIPLTIETIGNCNRYKFVLFIEKEGFYQLFKTYKLAEKFDIAIMSTKGMSVTAARSLVESLSLRGVTILVAHDFDKAGFSILSTLAGNTDRYQYKITPKIVDIGLHLKDAEEMDLESEPVEYSQKEDPRINLRESGASEKDCDFLVRQNIGKKKWEGERIELNAMTSSQLINWLETKFRENGVSKIIPNEETLRASYIRIYRRKILESKIKNLATEIENIDIQVPDNLFRTLSEQLAKNPHKSWDSTLSDVIKDFP